MSGFVQKSFRVDGPGQVHVQVSALGHRDEKGVESERPLRGSAVHGLRCARLGITRGVRRSLRGRQEKDGTTQQGKCA